MGSRGPSRHKTLDHRAHPNPTAAKGKEGEEKEKEEKQSNSLDLAGALGRARWAARVTARAEELRTSSSYVEKGWRPPNGLSVEEYAETKLREEDRADWSRQMKLGMQLVALMNSFLVSFYILHLQHNLQAANYHWGWKPLLVFPLVTSLFVMLPLLTSRFTVTEAYFSPNPDTLDATITELTQLEDDLNTIRRMWAAKGKPPFPDEMDKGVDEKGLAQMFSEMGVLVAGARLQRVFKAIDVDNSLTVTTAELLRRLEPADGASESLTGSTFGGTGSNFSFQASRGNFE